MKKLKRTNAEKENQKTVKYVLYVYTNFCHLELELEKLDIFTELKPENFKLVNSNFPIRMNSNLNSNKKRSSSQPCFVHVLL